MNAAPGNAPAPSPPLSDLDEEAALRTILGGTACQAGQRFFHALVENLARALGTQGAMVTEYHEERRVLRALAFQLDGKWIEDYQFEITGTPCETVIERRSIVHFPDRLIDLFPGQNDVRSLSLMSYIGMPLLDVDGAILGHLAAIDRRPLPGHPRVIAIFQIFAARAAAELQRIRCEGEVREREEKLARLIDSAMDAVIELDEGLAITGVNPAAEKVFGCTAQAARGQPFGRFLSPASRERLEGLVKGLEGQPQGLRSLWIPGGLLAATAGGREFSAEATLSRFDMHKRAFYSIILRDVNERVEAERKIRCLTVEAEYLREEIKAFQNPDDIIGRSAALRHVLRDVQQVAPTGASVLILGETGTGKELIARAIHAASGCKSRPFVKVNCAAIPASLMESELFGHEKGAFTGATQKREGRFSLADGGTIFLDEVGELPIDLQSKLLRVLQEGEFEPVGSSRTQKVRVRVLAATNRNLEKETREGRFREDLYYRLNVFPILLPPLRDRGEDIGLLAAAFAERHSRKLGRAIEPLGEDCLRRLSAYHWPGNVRELENVIERAAITAQGGRLNLDRALPEAGQAPERRSGPPAEVRPRQVRTLEEMEEMERRNMVLALETADWRVSGEEGAARLLGMKPSTLASRMKALGVRRPG